MRILETTYHAVSRVQIIYIDTLRECAKYRLRLRLRLIAEALLAVAGSSP